MWGKFFRGWRGAVLGTLVVLGGVASAVVTVVARRANDLELARVGAVTSLVFVVLMLVFVVPPLSRSARLEASRLDLPLRLTGGGVVFLLVFGVVAFAALNTGNNLLFLVFSILASALFVAWSAARVSLRDLAVSARFPDHIFAGEPAPVIVTLSNSKRVLPSFSIFVEARSLLDEAARPRWRFARRRHEKRPLAYFMYVPRAARAEQRVELSFPRRGHVLVTGFELSTRFPFGFFRLRRRLTARPSVDLVIYPKPRPAGDELHLLPTNAGQMTSSRRGLGYELHSLRDYLPRDDVRHVDWKATARAGRLTVREFTAEDERRVHVVFDTQMSEAAPTADAAGKGGGVKKRGAGGKGADEARAEELSERFERGVTIAASLVTHFVEERAEVRLTLGAEEGHYGAGREHLYDSLRRLALVAPAPAARAETGRAEFWERIAPPPSSAGTSFVILLTPAPPGSIPAHVWRASHVIYL
ncbi:MAG TPA: DUF58 domain-containing protein [Pyrinomonadaceae bacterium]|nr:DUF58 domain-containing protein [Pyrinomonadaceae bacterium]